MKEFRIRYQKGNDIYVEHIKAQNKKEAMYLFYMKNSDADILEIQDNEES